MKKIISLFLSILILINGYVAGNNSKYNEEKLSKMNAYTQQNKTCSTGQIVVVGDSITELWGKDESFTKLSTALGKEVYCRGISGDTSDRLLERLDDNVISIKPSKIIILIGTNDIAYGLMTLTTVKNVSDILQKLKAECPDAQIYLQAVYHTNKNVISEGETKNNMVGNRSNMHIEILNKSLAAVAEKENVNFIDLNPVLTDSQGNFNAEFTYDGLHPSDAGFAVITDEIIKAINP